MNCQIRLYSQRLFQAENFEHYFIGRNKAEIQLARPAPSMVFNN